MDFASDGSRHGRSLITPMSLSLIEFDVKYFTPISIGLTSGDILMLRFSPSDGILTINDFVLKSRHTYDVADDILRMANSYEQEKEWKIQSERDSAGDMCICTYFGITMR